MIELRNVLLFQLMHRGRNGRQLTTTDQVETRGRLEALRSPGRGWCVGCDTKGCGRQFWGVVEGGGVPHPQLFKPEGVVRHSPSQLSSQNKGREVRGRGKLFRATYFHQYVPR